MRAWKTAALATCIAGLLGACGSLDYETEFVHESPIFVIESQPGAFSESEAQALSVLEDISGADTIEFTGGWTGFRFDPEIEDLPPELIGLEVQGLDLEVMDAVTGEPTSADFVQRLEVYVLGNGLPQFMLASFTRPTEGSEAAAEQPFGKIGLEMVERVNLRAYLDNGSELYAYLQGDRPESDVAIRLLVDFHAYTRANP